MASTGTKAFVLALSRSLRHELADTGVRVQVVLPGAIATAFWNIAGTPVEHLPKERVMLAQDLVDAALAGLDQEEFVNDPGAAERGRLGCVRSRPRGAAAQPVARTPAERYQVKARLNAFLER